MEIHLTLVHAATQYDHKQATKKGHNRYALGLYLEAIDRIENDIKEKGISLREAIFANFTGRLLDVMLKAVNEPKATADEVRVRDREYFKSLGL